MALKNFYKGIEICRFGKIKTSNESHFRYLIGVSYSFGTLSNQNYSFVLDESITKYFFSVDYEIDVYSHVSMSRNITHYAPGGFQLDTYINNTNITKHGNICKKEHMALLFRSPKLENRELNIKFAALI